MVHRQVSRNDLQKIEHTTLSFVARDLLAVRVNEDTRGYNTTHQSQELTSTCNYLVDQILSQNPLLYLWSHVGLQD